MRKSNTVPLPDPVQWTADCGVHGSTDFSLTTPTSAVNLPDSSMRGALRDMIMNMLANSQDSARNVLEQFKTSGGLLQVRRVAIAVGVDYSQSYDSDDSDEEQEGKVQSPPAWMSWSRNESPNIESVRHLTINGAALSVPSDPYGLVLPLLCHMPNIRNLQLMVHGVPDRIPSNINLESTLPRFEKLESIVFGDVPLVFIHALIRKTGPRLKRLVFTGNPAHPRSAVLQVTEEAQSQRSFASSNATTMTRDYSERVPHRIDFAAVLFDLAFHPIHIRDLWVIPFLEPSFSGHVSRIARGAQFIPTFSLFARMTNLFLDRWMFTCMMSRSVPLPGSIRALNVLFNGWDAHDGQVAAFGEDCVRVDQAFGLLGTRLRSNPSESRSLRAIQLAYLRHGRTVVELEENMKSDVWMEFKAACAGRRIRLYAGSRDEPVW